jgi:transcription elongation factor/antiterminator RfaH
MTAHWYVLHSKPMKESLLWEQLGLQQIESYYPCIRTQPVSPRARRIKPYFPGYIFGHVDFERINLSSLHWMPGAAGIVSFDGIPSSVPDNVIAAIRRRVDEINAAGGELFDGLQQGEVIRIQEGPFSGYEAVFDVRLSGDERVRVLLKLLNRQQFPIELPSSYLRRKKQ